MLSIVRLIIFLTRSSRNSRFYKGTIALAVLCSAAAGGASALFIPVINSLFHAPASGPSWIYWAFGAVCLLIPTCRFLATYLLARLSNQTLVDLELTLSRQVLSAPLRQLETVGAPRIMAVLTRDVGLIVGAIAVIPAMIMQATMLTGVFLYLGLLSWKLLILVFAGVAIGGIVYRFPAAMATLRFAKARELEDKVYKDFQGLTQGIKELKIHQRRQRALLSRHLEPTIRSQARHRLVGQALFGAAQGWGQILLLLLIGLILLASPYLFSGISAETLTGYTLGLLYSLASIESLLTVVPNLAKANVSVEKVRSLGLTLEEEGREDSWEKQQEDLPSADWKSLQLKGVSYEYFSKSDDHYFTLGPVDLAFKPGQCSFLIGGNGSGKTTLVKLLTGLYSPKQGEVWLDGEEVGEKRLEAYRQNFSAVFAEPYVFDSLLGMEEVPNDVALQHLRGLELERKVKIKDGALSTVDLSTGQRKRLALLTALLEDRPIYVFDEWAAGQDPEFKEFFYREVLPSLKKKNKAVVVISHDDQYFDLADRIVKLDSGAVIFDSAISLSSESEVIEV